MSKPVGGSREPGTPLKNKRHEMFCLMLAIPKEDGKFRNPGEAYHEAYPDHNPETCKQEGHRLLKENPDVVARRYELEKEIQQEIIRRALPLRTILATIHEGMSAMAVKTATDGGKITDVQEFVDYPTRLKAAMDAAKLCGLVTEKVETNSTVTVREVQIDV